jgi:hypothetical protein
MYLSQLNPHPRDAHITFEEEGHKYTILTDPDSKYTSVTTWCHSHFPVFDADRVITNMMRSKNWNPSNKYWGMSREEIKAQWSNNGASVSQAGTDLHHRIECFMNNRSEGSAPTSPPEIMLCCNFSENDELEKEFPFAILPCHFTTPGAGLKEAKKAAFQTALTHRELLTQSVAQSIDQSGVWGGTPSIDQSGVWGGTPSIDQSGVWGRNPNKEAQEWQYFLNFVADHPDMKPYRTEWMIYDEDIKICGSIDMVYENLEDGTLSIFDWKRCKQITKVNPYNKFAITPEFAEMPDSNFWHYALQLNTYKMILENKYNKRVRDLCLVQLHPEADGGDYELYLVPDLTDRIRGFFAGDETKNK